MLVTIGHVWSAFGHTFGHNSLVETRCEVRFVAQTDKLFPRYTPGKICPMTRRKKANGLPDIKRLTGADLNATRSFLLKECFVQGKGFSSQYAGKGGVSCTTTAICVYAL